MAAKERGGSSEGMRDMNSDWICFRSRLIGLADGLHMRHKGERIKNVFKVSSCDAQTRCFQQLWDRLKMLTHYKLKSKLRHRSEFPELHGALGTFVYNDSGLVSYPLVAGTGPFGLTTGSFLSL